MVDKCEAAGKRNRSEKPTPRSPQHELVISLLRTGDAVEYRLAQLFREFELTAAQHQVLTILREADRPLPCLEIASRLITRVPAITSLVDKLEKQAWVERHRCDQDRRVWYVSLTAKGRRRLKQVDAPLEELYRDLCAGLAKKDCQQLKKMLDVARNTMNA